MNALDVPCPACSAPAGEKCGGVADASKALEVPHGARAAAALRASAGIDDIAKARAKRAAESALQPFGSLSVSSNNLSPAEHLTALTIAVVQLADACGLGREALIESFTEVARSLPGSAVPT